MPPSLPQARRQDLFVVAGVVALEVVVFVFDLRLPRGLHEWLLYLAPVVVCLFASRAWVPLATAAVSTGLLALGFHHSPQGSIDEIALKNREIGALVIWVMAVVTSRFVVSRTRIQTDHWLKEGQARLSETMQGERDGVQLAARVVAEACKRLGAHTGALFASRDHAPFKLVGGYAVSPERMRSAPAFGMGEGLVGQAARDRRIIRLSDVPRGYADVSSGLGVAPPREVIVAPLPANGGVAGVIELGFSGKAPALAEAYLTQIAEPIGAAFRSSHYQEHQRELLETSRVQAAELEERRRELQEINVELERQSATLQESQARLEEQHAELEERNDSLRRVTQALEQKTAELERASKYKSEFLANMSHELRTPLNSALILARLLADNRGGNLTAEQVKYAETIHHAGNDLLGLINDVLDISKVEAGKLNVEASSFTLAELAADIERSFRPLAQRKNLALTIDTAPGDARLHTDRGRLEQILRNLLANAVKFTEQGAVEATFSAEGERAVFRVRDTGAGIAPEEIGRIFDAFHQVENGARPEGTGLGLSIAQRLAALMGGDIEVDSALGEGSTFTLRIPRTLPSARAADGGARPATPPATIAARSSPRGAERDRSVADDRDALDGSRRTVLVIEDDEHFAFVLHDLVHGLDHQCLIATTGADGLALACEHRPDAIILDMKLPDMSGLAVLDQLKASPRSRHIPVHVLSVLDCTQSAREMGAVSTMLKPAKREEIVRTLSEIAARARQPVKRVLVVEDNAAQRDAIRALLAQDDLDVVIAQTAAAALEELARVTFDCVVLDLGLPDMSGFELVETMAAGERFAHPPVIIYTGRDLSADEQERLQRYARTIVLKGARSPERLLHEVTLFLHKVEEELPEDHQRLLAEIRKRDRALEHKNILIVDDDIRNVYALTRVLEEQRARVRIARNGKEALDELERDASVDLVLMDIMMPVMDGHEAIRKIRADPRFDALPVIALTARAMPDDQERCLRAGASDYLSKPVEVDRLLALLRVWAGHRRALFA